MKTKLTLVTLVLATLVVTLPGDLEGGIFRQRKHCRRTRGRVTSSCCRKCMSSPGDEYCPQSYMGTFNGVYYYYANDCNEPLCPASYVGDKTAHNVDYRCASCGGLGCTQPISDSFESKRRLVAPSVMPGDFPSPTWTYVAGRGDNDPPGGCADDPTHGKFKVGITGVGIIVDDGDDFEVIVITPDNMTRYFRLLVVQRDRSGGAPLRIGQELDPKKPHPKANSGPTFTPGVGQKHTITMNGYPYDVISMYGK